MHSHEVLRQAVDRVGVKAVAHDVRISQALLYKWCQPFDPADPDAGGARNPLDRLLSILRCTGDDAIVPWLCHQVGGFFIPNPPATPSNLDAHLLTRTQRLVMEFSDLLRSVMQAVEDSSVEPHEAERIRQAWNVLKSSGEAFAVACEKGCYNRKKPARDAI